MVGVRRCTAVVAALVFGAVLLPAGVAAAEPAAPSLTVAEDVAIRGAHARPSLPPRGFLDFGCYRDEVADVIDLTRDDGPLTDFPRGDIVSYCANYGAQSTGAVVASFAVTVGEAVDPTTDAGWASQDTALSFLIDTDGDDVPDFRASLLTQDDQFLGVVEEIAEDGTSDPACAATATLDAASNSYVLGNIPADCLSAPAEIRFTPGFFYDAPDAALWFDSAPSDGSFDGPLTTAPPQAPQCPTPQNGVDTTGEVDVIRVACGIGGTEPISQAVAVSEFTFASQGASWAVIARDDDFADALAGSALAFGQGPLLFTPSPASVPAGQDPGRLSGNTRAELIRVLPRRSVVYLMGGTNALAAGLEDELRELDFIPVRFAGVGREETAVAVSHEVRRLVELVASDRFPDLRSVMVATRSNWPDAVVAGSIASYWGFPVLLTNSESLHPATRARLEELRPEQIYVVGGTAVISTPVRQELETLAVGTARRAWCTLEDGRVFNACRVGGDTRVLTALGVGELNRFLLSENPNTTTGNPTTDAVYAAAINLFRGDAYAHALSATAPTGRFGGAAFIPLNGEAGTEVDINTEAWLCEFLPDLGVLLVMGDRDLIADAAAQQIRDQLQGGCA